MFPFELKRDYFDFFFFSDQVPWLQNEFAFIWSILRLPSYHAPAVEQCKW